MSSKPKSTKWADLQLAIAAISLTSVLLLWNMFAGPDKEKAAEKAFAEQAAKTPVSTEEPSLAPVPIPVETMPPVGYTILFGGEAPKSQVIVVQNQKSKGGGGGGGGGSVTSTSSS